LPDVTYFKPAGVPLKDLQEVCLTVDELEALRLKDVEGLDQVSCAERMGIAQSTFQRILTGARKKLAGAVVEGTAIRIQGGNFQFAGPPCHERGRPCPGPGVGHRHRRRGK